MTYQVNEIFTSVQGEGVLTGSPATFIRLQGCTVGCPWCDSRKTWGLNKDTPEYMRGYLKGVRQGDGSISGDSQDGHKRFYLQVTDEEIAATFAQYVKTLFGIDVNVHYKDDWERHQGDNPKKPLYTIAFGRKEIVSFLDEPVGDSPEERRGYVAAMFDCEGTHPVEHNRMSMSSKDKTKLDLVRAIMASQDMRVWMSDKADVQDMYRLSIAPDQREKFFDYFHPRVERKYGGYTALAGGTRMTVFEIMREVKAQHVVITGGEPTLYNLDPLIEELHCTDHFVQLETSGQNALKGILFPEWITWSPKENLNWDAPISIKMDAREVKWVVDDALVRNRDVVFRLWEFYRASKISMLPHFIFMPEGCPPSPDTIALARGLLGLMPEGIPSTLWRFGDRLQYRIGVR